jgi:hypothetical protein
MAFKFKGLLFGFIDAPVSCIPQTESIPSQKWFKQGIIQTGRT